MPTTSSADSSADSHGSLSSDLSSDAWLHLESGHDVNRRVIAPDAFCKGNDQSITHVETYKPISDDFFEDGAPRDDIPPIVQAVLCDVKFLAGAHISHEGVVPLEKDDPDKYQFVASRLLGPFSGYWVLSVGIVSPTTSITPR